jgi:nucleoside-diphosphate-sugar epimerase
MGKHKKILISGTASGLGQYVYSRFGGTAVTRATPENEWRKIMRSSFDLVVHCAASAPKKDDIRLLPELINDNVMLTLRLLQTSHKYFVYISTIGVYPADRRGHDEKEIIIPSRARNFYALTKMISESLVQEMGGRFLILRPSSLIGRESRMNNIMRLILQKRPVLSLAPKSRYNLVLYQDLTDFIVHAYREKITGIFNLAASKSMSVSEIARLCGHQPAYGRYCYDAGKISNAKIAKIFPVFRQTSAEVLQRFLRTLYSE